MPRTLLDPSDQAVLIGHATEALTRGTAGPLTVDLPSGVVARMSCRRISNGPVADGVVHVKLMAAETGAAAVPAPRSAMYLPGLVGSGVLWLRACREAEALYDSADWMTVEGEPGVGKLALARAVHQRRNPAAPFHVLDAESATRTGRSSAGASCSTARACWSSGTSTRSTPRSCTPWPARWARPGR